MDRYDVIIVGAGHSGAQAAVSLRQQGFGGTIAMVGKDPEPPYERPPLSKEYLARQKTFDRIMIRPTQFWADKNIELLLGNSVTAIEIEERVLHLEDGSRLEYGDLIWAAGGNARRLPIVGADSPNVHAVRDKADVDAIMAQLDAGATKAVVIGGGYIGLEAAAVLTKLGCEVVLLEALDRVLARVTGEKLSRFFEAEHRAHGVDVRLQAGVTSFELEGGLVKAVHLDDGEVLLCDLVIVGIGIEPAIGPLERAGAVVSNGVEVDENCRTSLPNVYAVGDCAAHFNGFADGAIIRLESVQNATDMAVTAAKSICGDQTPYKATPWFWSNQYDLKLQTVGLCQGHDQAVLRGDPADRSFSVVYLKMGRVIALDCVNATKDYVQGRKLVEAHAVIVEEAFRDSTIPLKDLLNAQRKICGSS